MKIKWLRKALRNLESIHKYISKDNPEAASRLVNKVQEGVNQLADFPLMGRKGRVEGTRELIIDQICYHDIINLANYAHYLS